MSITDILQQWNRGDSSALNRLIPVVHQRLHDLAEQQLQNESFQVLQPTELVNLVYLRLTERERQQFRDRKHFFGMASKLIRRILLDLARRRRAAKRDFTLVVADFPEVAAQNDRHTDVEALDAALAKLAELDPRQARIVDLRFYGGLSIADTAQLLEISPATVKRDWEVAKAWLKRELS